MKHVENVVKIYFVNFASQYYIEEFQVTSQIGS